MKTEDIKRMALAYQAVTEKKMDPVGQEDGDIDNDGDVDKSDKYLHNRRKAIKKAMKMKQQNRISGSLIQKLRKKNVLREEWPLWIVQKDGPLREEQN